VNDTPGGGAGMANIREDAKANAIKNNGTVNPAKVFISWLLLI
jgi:hypothetical protein